MYSLNGAEIAIILGINAGKVYADIAKKKLQASKNNSGEWIITEPYLTEYLRLYLPCPERSLDLFGLYRLFMNLAHCKTQISEKEFNQKCLRFTRYKESLSNKEKDQSCYYRVIWSMYQIVRNKKVNMKIRMLCAAWLEYQNVLTIQEWNGDECGIKEEFDRSLLVAEIEDLPESLLDDFIIRPINKESSPEV
ncbi:MAG: hypothetical protein ACOYCB_09855 [Fastidiosipilaceae bacterium]|jgi:hypothetical protein